MRSHPALDIERSGDVLTVRLDDPATRNAQTPSLWSALADAAAAVPDDVRLVVLAGAGSDFSAGLHRGLLTAEGLPGEPDVVGLALASPTQLPDVIAGFQRAFTCWRDLPMPVLAAVQGHAVGAGFQLALAADLRVCTPDASFAMREVTLGLVPDLAGTTPLARLVGAGRAFEMCATGRAVGAQEALQIGLVNAVGDLDDEVRRLADSLRNPAAVREVKALFRTAGVVDAPTQEQLERQAQTRMLRALVKGPVREQE